VGISGAPPASAWQELVSTTSETNMHPSLIRGWIIHFRTPQLLDMVRVKYIGMSYLEHFPFTRMNLQIFRLFFPFLSKCLNFKLRLACEKWLLLALEYMDLQLPRVRLSLSILSMFLTNFLAYLEINPEIQLSIIDADSTVEGVWSKSSVYAGPTCDVPVPTFEFSDLHMDEEFNIPK
jgi:hypothetical protein